MTEGKDVRGLIKVSSSQIMVFWGLMRVIHGLIMVNESDSRVSDGTLLFSMQNHSKSVCVSRDTPGEMPTSALNRRVKLEMSM